MLHNSEIFSGHFLFTTDKYLSANSIVATKCQEARGHRLLASETRAAECVSALQRTRSRITAVASSRDRRTGRRDSGDERTRTRDGDTRKLRAPARRPSRRRGKGSAAVVAAARLQRDDRTPL